MSKIRSVIFEILRGSLGGREFQRQISAQDPGEEGGRREEQAATASLSLAAKVQGCIGASLFN